MTTVGWFMLAGGLVLATFCTWQRLGRNETARSWATSLAPRSREVQVLVVRPLIAVVLVVAPFGSLAGSGSAVQVAIFLTLVACAVLVLVYMLIPPLQAPRWLMPEWYRIRLEKPRVVRG